MQNADNLTTNSADEIENLNKSQNRSGFWTLVIFTIAVFVFVIAQIFGLIETEGTTFVGNCLKTIIGVVGIAMSYQVVKTLDGQLKHTWKILTWSYIFNTGGDIIWHYYVSILGSEIPFPSFADISFLVSYPLMFWALFSYPTKNKASENKKLVIDIAIVMLSGSTVVWYFIIRPTVSALTAENSIPTFLNLSYTVGDMVMILGILVAFFRGIEDNLKRSFQIIVAGVVCLLIADLGFAYFTLEGTYFGGHWIENFFIFNSLSHVYAAYYQRCQSLKTISVSETKIESPTKTGFNYFPYVAIAIGYGILFVESKPHWNESSSLQISVFLAIGLTILVVFRQAFAERESLRLLGEKSAEEQELRFRTLVENSSDLMTIYDSKGELIFRSPSIKKILGYEVEEIAAMSGLNLIHPDDLDAVEFSFSQICEGKIDSYQMEYRALHKDGKYRFLESIAKTYIDKTQTITGVLINSRDVTQRKEDEEKLSIYNTKLEQSNRELQDFAYVASHDLQEPLRKVQAFGERLDVKYSQELGDEGRDYLKRMRDAAGRMQILINDLLSFSRISTKGKPFIQVDLAKICKEVCEDLEIRIEEKNAKVEISDLLTIDADPLQMRQLFQNLIGNALKFHQKDSFPLIKVYEQADDLKKNLKKHYTIIVEDNGIGFDEKYLDRIFTVFQRLNGRADYEGSGVGLAVCRKIIERHKGQITAQSREGEGTKFIINLPKVQG
jgi:PAS domain S-box-containing protein